MLDDSRAFYNSTAQPEIALIAIIQCSTVVSTYGLYEKNIYNIQGGERIII
jgi:hypothetical protein